MSGKVARKVRQGPVEIDFERSALLVNFTVETVSTDENGRTVEVLDRKPESRRIKINSLNPDKNLALLASQIVESCKYVHASRTEEIEQLLIKLRKHVMEQQASMATADGAKETETRANAASAASGGGGGGRGGRGADSDDDAVAAAAPKRRPQDDLPPADMDKLDDYLELLYAVGGKVRLSHPPCILLASSLHPPGILLAPSWHPPGILLASSSHSPDKC